MDVARRESTGIRAFGEMVALLQDDGNDDGAIALEQLWNDLGDTHEFTLFCAYPSAAFDNPDGSMARWRICCAHSQVIG